MTEAVMERVERVAAAVMYEGFLLYPYRRSATKNQQRWTFGGVYPREYSRTSGGDDPWIMQTQYLVDGNADAMLEVKLRFLQIVDRRVLEGTDRLPVEELWIGERVYRPWEEAVERTREAGPSRMGDLAERCELSQIDVPVGSEEEQLLDDAGEPAGSLLREWWTLNGQMGITAELLRPDLWRVTVRVINTGPQQEERSAWTRRDALRHAFISTHSIARVQGGAFVSLLEPPAEYAEAASECQNIKTWPVLAGERGDRHIMLSSPIILYDYPEVSEESPGDLFDATEIDELLTLSILTLTDAEKQEMRESDPRSREILERTELLSPEQVLKLHAAVRAVRPSESEES